MLFSTVLVSYSQQSVLKMCVKTYETPSERYSFCLRTMHFVSLFITPAYVLFLVKLRWPKKKNIYDIQLVSFDMFN